MMLPTIHMNGTSTRMLLWGYSDAISGIQTALEGLASAAPNSRDYYPQGRDAYATAYAEHDARKQALMKVLNELQVLAEHVADRQK